MDRQSFLLLTTSTQWILFLGIGLIVYSWVEPKKITRQAGQIAFVLLGIIASWIIVSNQIILPETASADPAIVESKTINYFNGLIATGLLGLLGLLMPKINPRWEKIPNVILIPVALILFFAVYSLQKQ